MIKLFAVIFLLALCARAHADYSGSPFVLLYTTNTWTQPQINLGAYPDWLVDGSFSGLTVKWLSPVRFKSLDLDGDLYILNIYTDPQ